MFMEKNKEKEQKKGHKDRKRLFGSWYKKIRISSAVIQKLFGSRSIKKQLYATYLLALCMPIAILGIFLVTNTYRLLRNYHMDLVASDNLRVKAIFFEITTQVYNISENVSAQADGMGHCPLHGQLVVCIGGNILERHGKTPVLS